MKDNFTRKNYANASGAKQKTRVKRIQGNVFIPPSGATGAVENGNTNSTAALTKKVRGNALIHWFFTWNNYGAYENPEKTELDIWNFLINSLKNKIKCKTIFMQEEIGEEGTKHIQGNISLHKKMRWSQFNLPTEIHWEPTRNISKANEYCIKEKTCNGRKFIFPKPLNCIKEEQFYPWQKTIKELCNGPIDERTINWVYEQNGNTGKSAFCRFMCLTYNCLLLTGGTCKDIANLIKNTIESGNELREDSTIFFDLARNKRGNISYDAVESLKNGVITNLKFDVKTFFFNSPHIWIFSNHFPKTENMSKDRWKIWSINSNKELFEYGKHEGIIDVHLDDYEKYEHNVIVDEFDQENVHLDI